MIVHQHTQIGTFHNNHCEDYVLHAELSTNRLLIAVMDGCTMGTESYFAATLVGKLLRKIAREHHYLDYAKPQENSLAFLLKLVFQQLFADLKTYVTSLHLQREEVLTTVVIGIIATDTHRALIQVIGDGVVCSNGRIYAFEQNNTPDYLGYHLQQSFAAWYPQQQQLLQLEQIEDLSISTDGIFTFRSTLGEAKQLEDNFLLDFLLQDGRDLTNERMFHKKLYHLKKTYYLEPTDDLGIVRVVLHPSA